MDMLTTENIKYDYREGEPFDPARAVLRGITLTIEKGQFVAIVGHNGSGKSTLAKHFNAILVPKEGDVFVLDINTRDEKRLYDIRQRVGMVFQNPDNQIVATIVEEDVAFACENLGVPPDEIRRRVDDALEIVGMTKYKEHPPHKLSGGQKQRVAIAGILAMNPECLVLDEPTAMLDPKGRQRILATLQTLNEQGITVVLITHNMDEAALADRVIVVNDGSIVLDGTPLEVFEQVDIIHDCGLHAPAPAELVGRLRREGLDLPPVLSVDDAVDALAAILTTQKGQ